MDLVRLLTLLAGLSSLSLLSLVVLKKWHRQQMIADRLRRVGEALEQAEERLVRFQERHDRILFQINSHYLCHREMEAALRRAERAMEEALQFCTQLRRMQMKLLTLYSTAAAAGCLGDQFTVSSCVEE